MELFLSFLRENTDKLCFIELPQNFVTGCLSLKKYLEKENLRSCQISQKILPV